MLLIQFYTIVGCLIDVYTLEGVCTRGDNLAVANCTRGCHTDKLRCSWWPRGGRRDCLSFSAEYNFHSKYQKTLGSRVMTTGHPMGLLYFPFMLCLFFFNERLNAVLNCVNNEKKLCYLMGDYNINILNYDSRSATVEFVDMLYSHAFLPLINRPTRITQNSATIIDNIFTNNIGESECGHNVILVTDISDHFPIFHIWKHTQIAQTDDTYISSRNYSHVNKLSFQQALSEIDWS